MVAFSQIGHFCSNFGEYVGVERPLSSLQTGRSGGLSAKTGSSSRIPGFPVSGHSSQCILVIYDGAFHENSVDPSTQERRPYGFHVLDLGNGFSMAAD
jgi:hypothetical protein